DHRGGKMPDADIVLQQLEAKLKQMHDAGDSLDVITFAGNGEPTLHPEFARVIDQTLSLRNQYYPQVKVSVLSNGTRMTVPAVHEALMRVDNNILKLDGAFDETVRLIDQPVDSHYCVSDVVKGMMSYQGELIVQTMFVKGSHNGHCFDNTTPEEVGAWCNLMRQIRPRQIMVYSLDRPTPEHNLTAISKAEMTELVAPLVAEGFDISISGK
ncbi:MAG: radical SAM protein, partial [Bacteroidales bacterium]|nr:radical SAM protein [Bacteroidales bacterium]